MSFIIIFVCLKSIFYVCGSYKVLNFPKLIASLLDILGSPYQNRFQNLGHYPKFSSESHCKGCEKLLLNGFEWRPVSSVDFLIMVPSAVDHFEHRMRVRNTWAGAPSSYQGLNIRFDIMK